MAGNIPTYQAKQKLLPIAGGARAWPEMMTREQRAMAQFGGAMGNVAFKWQAERDNFEISRLDAEIDNFHYTALRQLEEDWIGGKFTDADQFKQIEDDYEKARKKKLATLIKGKRGLIADRVAQYAKNNEVPDKTSFYTSLFPKEKEFRAVEALKTIEGYKQQGDADKALMAIEQNKYWLGLNKAEVLKASLQKDIAAYQYQALIETIHQAAKAKPFEDAIIFLNDVKGIEKADRNDLIARRKRQNEIETATTNRKVRWDTLRKVTSDPERVTDDYLESLVKPNSLTWDDAEELKKIRDDKTDPLQSPRAQLYFNMLDTLYSERDTDAEEAYQWDIANDKLVTFFKAKPPTAKEASEFYAELTSEKKWDWLNKLWEFYKQSPFGWGYRKAFGEKKEQALPILGEGGLPEKEPTAEELRVRNTKEAYEQGKRLGYWD